ncbi:MAG TPA: hypothetical protein ENI77_00950 [Nitrospirae bacterium]|nr:hypothetical protein [Nitrospirota bacterium]
MISPPPAYKYAPVILVVTVSAVVYWIVSSVEKDIPAPSSIGRIIDEAKRAVGDVKQVLEKARKPSSARREQSPGKAISEPDQKLLAGESFSLLDDGRISRLRIIKSSGVIAVFNSVENADNKKPALKLSIREMGAGKNSERFASGVIDFIKPVRVRNFRGISITLKGRGVEGFGLAALSKKGPLFFRWDFAYNSGFQERGAYSFQFSSFDLWEYNTITSKYTRMEKGPLPEKIDQIQVYLKAGHLANQKSGELWIQSLALQDYK